MKIILSSGIRLLAGIAALAAFAVNADAAIIFEDTFDVAPTGATRTLNSPGPNVTNTIISTTPLGSGAYLNTSATAFTNNTVPVTYTPALPASSWAQLDSSVVVGANTFVTLNGGFDLFVRPNTTTPGNDSFYRPVDISTRSGTTGLRLILGSNGTTGLKQEIIVQNGNAQNAGTGAGNVVGGAFTGFNSGGTQVDAGVNLFTDGSVVHIAYTFSTDPTTGLITAKTFITNGTGAIDTTTLTPVSTINIYLNATGIGSDVLPSGAWTVGGTIPAGGNVSYDTIRMYDVAPTVFGAIPEPRTVGLLTGGLVFLSLRKRSRHI